MKAPLKQVDVTPCWVGGIVVRVVQLTDGSGRIEAWTPAGWVPSKGVSLADIFDATSLTSEDFRRFGISS